MTKLLVIFKIGTIVPKSIRSVTISNVSDHGVVLTTNGSHLFYYDKNGKRSFIPCENVVFFGDYYGCEDLMNI